MPRCCRGGAARRRSSTPSWPATPLPGVSVMLMDEGLDTGPVYKMQSTRSVQLETGGELRARLAELCAELLRRPCRKSSRAGSSRARRTTRGLPMPPSWIRPAPSCDWGESAVRLSRQVRAFSPRSPAPGRPGAGAAEAASRRGAGRRGVAERRAGLADRARGHRRGAGDRQRARAGTAAAGRAGHDRARFPERPGDCSVSSSAGEHATAPSEARAAAGRVVAAVARRGTVARRRLRAAEASAAPSRRPRPGRPSWPTAPCACYIRGWIAGCDLLLARPHAGRAMRRSTTLLAVGLYQLEETRIPDARRGGRDR
jgi:hypothetical protein